MGLVLPPIEAYQVQHLPIVKAYADKIGVVEVINQLVSTEMAIDPGTIVLGMILDTLSGRSPLYRLAEFFTHQDTALLLGKPVTPRAFDDDTVGRVLDRLYDTGTMQVFTACAVRAEQILHCDKRSVHFDTTSVTVYGEYLPPEESQEHKRPFRIPYGYSKDKRPDLQQCVFATRCIDRAVPIWGQPEEGNASGKTGNNTLLSTIATFLAQHGVAPGAYIYVADAAWVTEDNLAALGDTLCISRLPATYNECGRLIAEAVAHHSGKRSASSPIPSRLRTGRRRPIKPMRAQLRSTGRPIGRWWSTPARRTNGGSSGWPETSRPRIAPPRPLHGSRSSRSTSAAPMRRPRQRSSTLCSSPTIGWTSRWRNSLCMVGAGPVPRNRAQSKPCAIDSKLP